MAGLELLSDKKSIGVVGGFGASPEATAKRTINKMVANVLCVRCNSALSNFDSLLKNLYLASLDMANVLHSRGKANPQKRHWLFNGIDVERAFIKCLLANMLGGVITTLGKASNANNELVARLTASLLEGQPLPHPLGLYVLAQPPESKFKSEVFPEFGTRIYEGEGGVVMGAEFKLPSTAHLLWLNPGDPVHCVEHIEGANYRPGAVSTDLSGLNTTTHYSYGSHGTERRVIIDPIPIESDLDRARVRWSGPRDLPDA